MDPRLMAQLPQQAIPTFPQAMFPGPSRQPMPEFRQPASFRAMEAFRMNALQNGFPAYQHNFLDHSAMPSMQQVPMDFKAVPVQHNSPFAPWKANVPLTGADRQGGSFFHSPGTSHSSTVPNPGDVKFASQVDTYGIPNRIITRYGYAPPSEANPLPPQGVPMPEPVRYEPRLHFNPTRYIVQRPTQNMRPADSGPQMNDGSSMSALDGLKQMSQNAETRNENGRTSSSSSTQPEILHEKIVSPQNDPNFGEDDEERQAVREKCRKLREQEQMRNVIAQRIETLQKSFTSAPKSASELPRPRREPEVEPTPRKPRAEKQPPKRKEVQEQPLPAYRVFLEAGYRKALARQERQESRKREASKQAPMENIPLQHQEQPEQPADSLQQENSRVVQVEGVQDDQEHGGEVQQTSRATIRTDYQEPAGAPTQPSGYGKTAVINKYFHPKLTLREIVSRRQSFHNSSRISHVLDRSKETLKGNTELTVSSSSNKESRKRSHSPDGAGENDLHPAAPTKKMTAEMGSTTMGRTVEMMVVPESTTLELEALPIRSEVQHLPASNQRPHDNENGEAVQEELSHSTDKAERQVDALQEASATTYDVESHENNALGCLQQVPTQKQNYSAQEACAEPTDEIVNLLEQARLKIRKNQKSLDIKQIKNLIEELEEQLGSLNQALHDSEILQTQKREYVDDRKHFYYVEDEPGPSIQAPVELDCAEAVAEEKEEEDVPITQIIPRLKYKIVYRTPPCPDMPALEPVDCLQKVKRPSRHAQPPQLTDQNGDVVETIEENSHEVRPISRFPGFDPEKPRAGRQRKFLKGRGTMLKNCIRRFHFQRLDEWKAIEKEYLPNLQGEYEKLYSAQESEMDYETIFSTAKSLQSMVLEIAKAVDFPEGCPAKQFDPSKKREKSKNGVRLRSSGRLAVTPKVDYREK